MTCKMSFFNNKLSMYSD